MFWLKTQRLISPRPPRLSSELPAVGALILFSETVDDKLGGNISMAAIMKTWR